MPALPLIVCHPNLCARCLSSSKRSEAKNARDLRRCFDTLVGYTRAELEKAQTECRDAYHAVQGMQTQLQSQHRLQLPVLKPFGTDRYSNEIDAIERAALRALPTLPLLLPGARINAQRMIMAACQHLAAVLDKAGRQATGWLNTLTSPLDRHMRDQQNQLKRREESLNRMSNAHESLSNRLAELAETHANASLQLQELTRNHSVLRTVIKYRHAFSTALIAWQKTHGRHDLPWQNTTDAYRIWVLAKLCCSRPKVTAVKGYYARFLERFLSTCMLWLPPL